MASGLKVRETVESVTGMRVRDVRALGAGHRTGLYLLDMTNGERLVAKIAAGDGVRLDIEGWMLGYLREHSDLPVPEVVLAQPDALVMPYVGSGSGGAEDAEIHAAELLAALHEIRSDTYGLERDTVIGPLHQPNTPSDNWVTFFRDCRLLPMAQAAFEEGRIGRETLDALLQIADCLDSLIGDAGPPSLLHGDVWSGNVIFSSGRVAAFIDPAIYFGDAEMELAFITLFNTFGEAFFRRYRELRPIRDGFFEGRRALYNLYPLLVHARLFGPSWAREVAASADRILRGNLI